MEVKELDEVRHSVICSIGRLVNEEQSRLTGDEGQIYLMQWLATAEKDLKKCSFVCSYPFSLSTILDMAR